MAGRKLVDIAEELGLPEGTVRRWKCTHKWDSERSDKEASVRKNKHTKGHKGKVIAEDIEQVIGNPDLTDKQRLFCLHYVRCFNATKAYQKAFDVDYATANAHGYELLSKVVISKEIQRLKQNRLNREMLDEHDIFQKYMDIAFADITDYVTFGTREVQYMDKKGQEHTAQVPFVDLKESCGVDGTLVREVKQGKDGTSIKLEDRMKALDWLADHMGMATPEQKIRMKKLEDGDAGNGIVRAWTEKVLAERRQLDGK
nr:terminase small subunit [uncultured Acetatifactor sp.]